MTFTYWKNALRKSEWNNLTLETVSQSSTRKSTEALSCSISSSAFKSAVVTRKIHSKTELKNGIQCSCEFLLLKVQMKLSIHQKLQNSYILAFLKVSIYQITINSKMRIKNLNSPKTQSEPENWRRWIDPFVRLLLSLKRTTQTNFLTLIEYGLGIIPSLWRWWWWEKPCLKNLLRRTSLNLRSEPSSTSSRLGLNFPKLSKK